MVSEEIWNLWAKDDIFKNFEEREKAVENYKPQRSIEQAEEYLKQNKKRLILEMRSGKLTPEKAQYILDEKMTLNGEKYQL